MSEQPKIPPPPDGGTSWLDYMAISWGYMTKEETQHAKAELAALRQKLSDTEGWLATARQQALDLDAQRAEAVRERDEAKALAAQGRAAGRAEAAQMFMERFEAECFDMNGDGNGLVESYPCGEETSTRWIPEKVRELFDVAPDGGVMASLLDRAEGAYWEAQSERDEARAKLAELREAALALGELEPKGEMWITDSLRYAAWNVKIAKLRAEQGGEGKP